MIRHLFTLIWNRKRANALLIAEIFLAFVVLFAVGSMAVYMRQNYQAPLGFSYANVWRVALSTGTQPRAEQFATLQQVIERLKATPGVAGVTRSASNTPFEFSNNNGGLDAGPTSHPRHADMVDYYNAGPELHDVMGLRLTAGRWFDRRDEAATRRPVVITELTRAALFPGQSAVGQRVRSGEDEWQVVGVVSAYRGGGQLSQPRPGLFLHEGPRDTAEARNTLLVRVQPGSGAALEKKMGELVRATGPGWTSSIHSLAEQRRTQLKFQLALPAILGVVCLFLIINVALGLFGVLWQTINQRRAEIGLRRAIGASGGAISRQILGEILVVTTFGLLLGLLVAAQFPLLGAFGVKVGVYGQAMLLATALIYGLTVVCALYPSRLAAGIHPAVALREE